MVTVRRTEEYLSHSGTKGMKWGYNDGQRNGKRTAAELKKVAELRAKLHKENPNEYGAGSGDFEGDYHEANNMLRYLGITLDLQSDDAAVAKTMAIYENMRDTKDKYKTQYEWLNAFSTKLSAAGYDMKAVDDYLLQNKAKLNEIPVGSGSGNREKSNQDWADNTATTKSKSSSSSTKKNEEKTEAKDTETELAKKTREHKESRKGTAKHSLMDDEPGEYLEHHGILGMKWGQRRYQNADGSLTALGRLRYGSAENYRNAQRYKVKRKQDKVESRNKKIETKLKKKYETSLGESKSTKKMSDDEIKARINRLKLEDEYNTWNNKVNPQTKSKGRKFIDSFKEVAAYTLKESAKQAGKDLLTDYLKKEGKELLGLNKVSKYEQAKKDAEYYRNLEAVSNAKKTIENNKKKDDDKYADAKKESDYWKNLYSIENNKKNLSNIKNENRGTSKTYTLKRKK